METAALEMLSAGVAASFAVLVTNPMDVMKTRLQMNNELISQQKLNPSRSYSGLTHCFLETFRSEGIRGIQRGLNIAVVREFGKCFIRIGMYDPLTRAMNATYNSNQQTSSTQGPFFIKLLAACICGPTSAFLFNPLDLAKTRTQAACSTHSASHHTISASSSVSSTLKAIIRPVNNDKSDLRRLWYGSKINMMRSLAFTPVMLPANSTLKTYFKYPSTRNYFLQRLGVNETLYFGTLEFFCPLIASFLGILAMNPVDVVRTRLYNQPEGSNRLYQGAGDCVLKMFNTEGPLSFWKGTKSHFFRVGPQTVLTFVFMGQIRRLLNV